MYKGFTHSCHLDSFISSIMILPSLLAILIMLVNSQPMSSALYAYHSPSEVTSSIAVLPSEPGLLSCWPLLNSQVAYAGSSESYAYAFCNFFKSSSEQCFCKKSWSSKSFSLYILVMKASNIISEVKITGSVYVTDIGLPTKSSAGVHSGEDETTLNAIESNAG